MWECVGDIIFKVIFSMINLYFLMTAKLSKSDKCRLCLEDQAVESPIHIFSDQNSYVHSMEYTLSMTVIFGGHGFRATLGTHWLGQFNCLGQEFRTRKTTHGKPSPGTMYNMYIKR